MSQSARVGTQGPSESFESSGRGDGGALGGADRVAQLSVVDPHNLNDGEGKKGQVFPPGPWGSLTEQVVICMTLEDRLGADE